MKKEKLYPLANILFPDSGFAESQELFFRARDVDQTFPGLYGTACRRISFDTWMNLFAVSKWNDVCDLGGLFLRMEMQGRIRLQVMGHDYTPAFGTVNSVLIDEFYSLERMEEIIIAVPDARAYTGISFALEIDMGSPYALGAMAWCTDAAPRRKSRIAVVTCTFRREKFVRKTMGRFTEYMKNHGDLADAMHMFVVDNGRTLPIEEGNEYVDILPNINAGGAGGFTRGLMEANDRHFTRCLFMDDDVEIMPEAFFRTLRLADYLKREYEDAMINGAMMDLYDRALMFEDMAFYNDNFGIDRHHYQLHVNQLDHIFQCIDVDKNIFKKKWMYAAWWYACFSLSLFRDEYPLPIFIRCDDVEWSWRKRGMPIISMNGICVWHAPFMWRDGKFVHSYHAPRNMFFITAIYQENAKSIALQFLKERFRYTIDTLDYVSAELVLACLHDLLKGRKCFEENPERQMQRLRRIARKSKVVSGIGCKELDWARSNAGQGTNDAGISLYEIGLPPVAHFMGKKRVKVYNLATASYELLVRDEEKAARLGSEFQMVYQELENHYDNLVADFRRGYEVFKTRAFWNRYLRLDEAAGKGQA